MQSIAGAKKGHQVVKEGCEVVVEKGDKLGAEPSDAGPGCVV
jgi:hypothetical protein